MMGRLNEIGIDPTSPTEAGMFYMGQMAASLLHAQADHARYDHNLSCAELAPLELVRTYARATTGMRDEMRAMGAPKAGG